MHPLQFDVESPEKRNRGTVLIRLLLVIPHAIVLGLWGALAHLLAFFQWWIILFTGKRNAGISAFHHKFLQYWANVYAYLGLLHDSFPAFGPDDPRSPVRFSFTPEADAPSRLTNFFRLIWLIPAAIIADLLNTVSQALGVVNWLMIVFTGRAPKATLEFVTRVQRYMLRFVAYALMTTDRYPSFD